MKIYNERPSSLTKEVELLEVLVGGDVVEADVAAGGADGDLLAVAHVHGVCHPHLEATLRGTGLLLLPRHRVGLLAGQTGQPHRHRALLPGDITAGNTSATTSLAVTNDVTKALTMKLCNR